MQKKLLLLAISFLVVGALHPAKIFAQTPTCDADINSSGLVDTDDYNLLVSDFLKEPPANSRSDINKDGYVDLTDYSWLVKSFSLDCTTPPPPPPPPPAATSGWTQDGGNAQRTGYTTEQPTDTWSLAWTWNGPDANGGTGGHFYDLGTSATDSVEWEGRTVMGGGNVYVPGLSNGVYALNKTTGQQVWNYKDNTAFKTTPAYDGTTGSVLVVGENGKVYKLNATNGTLSGSYSTTGVVKSPLIVGNYVYVTTTGGDLLKIKVADMTLAWKYTAGANAATPPSYSTSRDIIIFGTNDLYLRAVNNSNGTEKWKTRLWNVTSGATAKFFSGYWPVIAEGHGIVFARLMVLNGVAQNVYSSGPSTAFPHAYPATSTETRNYLNTNPQFKSLLALNLDNGTESFVPAVGPGGVEALRASQPVLLAPPAPVVSVLNGVEVVYLSFRSEDGAQYDGRWDSHIGEMVLDSSTVPGLVAGDVRFVQTNKSMSFITDEQTPITMAGSTFFYAHWGASEAHKVLDRTNAKGTSFANPITTKKLTPVVRRIAACGTANTTTHYSTCGMTLFDDGKYWEGPGWWVYWNVLDPPTQHRGAYSEGLLPRYTYVSDGMIVVEGNGGDLFVLKYQ